MKDGNERKSSSSLPPPDCDVGLGLKMQLQATESYSCKNTVTVNLHHYQQLTPSGRDSNNTSSAGDGDGGGPFSSNKTNRMGSAGDVYEVADGVVFARGFHNTASRASAGGDMAVSGKALFTASQWQELERQKMIHKYIMASVPVPPQLLLPTSRSPPLASVSQSNTSGLDLRYPSSGSDPEPWRCKRTDGKKWRCSRDVAPDQKYCERHAHKTRPRSRKHVEISSHNNYSQQPLTRPITTTNPPLQPLQRPDPQFPTMASTTSSHDQTRCIEWFMRGGSSSNSSSVSTCNQEQWQQLMQIPSSSSRLELNKDNTRHQNRNVSVLYQPHYEDNKQDFITLNPYIPEANHHHQFGNSILDSKMTSLQEGLSQNAERTQTTRHFIDAWEKEGLSESLTEKFSPSSLSLSMSAENNENGDYLGIGIMNSNRENSDEILKPQQWVNLNPVSWINSPPGGPLGEALCLGNATITTTTTRGGYGNSNTNSSSSCSKSSCEDGRHALNFIG